MAGTSSVSIGLLLFLYISAISCENSGTNVAPALQRCYNTSELLETDRRLPATINVLIDLVRKAEDGRITQDARQLSIELIQRFRQDGIIRHPNTVNSQFSLPFSPLGRQHSKNRVLLLHLIPGNAVNFPNETLNALEQCSLHFMMSSTVDVNVRGDEANVCSRLGRYQRRIRSASDDIEVFKTDPFEQYRGNIEEEIANDPEETTMPIPEENIDVVPEKPDKDIPVEPVPMPGGFMPRSDQTSRSDCPVEGGVIYTRWGAVQAGTVIAGIAAGLEQQFVPIDNQRIDNRYAATLSGDLAEAALFQVGERGDIRSVGATGGWNSTQVPRWYFINENQHYEMTDADIRAGLDGLIMALNVQAWRNSFQNIKVSQILDMYYSPRGVFSDDMRACNRNHMLTTVAPTDTLQSETSAFASLFNGKTVFPSTIIADEIPNLISKAIPIFNEYVPRMNDLTCITDTTSRNRIETELIIVLDAQWPHNVAHAAISYLLDNLDVNRFESSYTIINGVDGSTIVNTSSTILDYHQQFNLTVQQTHANGFQYNRVYVELEKKVRDRMDNSTNVGGKSMIAILMPFQGQISEEDRSFARERIELFRSTLPDLRILALGGGNRDAYIDFTTGGNVDAFNLPNSVEGSSVVGAVNPVLDRIREIPRRIVNPACGSHFTEVEVNSVHTMEDFVEPQTINYYKIAPNYFFGDGERVLRVRGHGAGGFMVCTSRTDELVSQNSTAPDRDCRNINSDEQRFELTGLCTSGLIIDCEPLYFSVHSTAANPTPQCSEWGCRFPDNIQFTITLENFSCRSSTMKIAGSLALVALMVALLKF